MKYPVSYYLQKYSYFMIIQTVINGSTESS